MSEISINQVEYSNTPDGPVVHVFGRDNLGRSRRLDVTGFYPYFFIPEGQRDMVPETLHVDEENEYRSIRGDPLMRVYTDKPNDIYEVRDHFDHYEADIHFTVRFLIDAKIKSGVSFPESPCNFGDVSPLDLDFPARVCIIDIECDDSRGFPDSAKDSILCLTCHDSFADHYTTFAYGIDEKKIKKAKVKENGCFDSKKHTVVISSSEKEMLQRFGEYIQEFDPDILTGWNFTGFDAPYIFGRMSVLGLPRTSIARLPDMGNKVEIRGRQLFDLLAGYKRMHLGEKESYRLDAIALAETGRQKVRFAGKVFDLWKYDPENLIFYNFTDVELCVAIDKKDETIAFHRHIAHYVGCPLEKTTNSMPIIDVLVVREAKEEGFILPSKGRGDTASEAFEGAVVFESAIGVKENVVVLDLKSLYPMAMMTINASPETKDPNGELRAPNGVRFRAHPDGLVRKIQSRILQERDATKKERNTYPFGSPEYKLLDMKQDVIKIIMNSYYGVSGNPMFRLYDRDIGAATTSIGRAILEHNRKLVEGRGYPVVTGDTDSVFCEIPKSAGQKGTMAIARGLENLLNSSYDKFAKDVLNADVQYFSVKFEKLYERFFSGGKKKRYAGLLVWKEGKIVHEVDITGYETERSDSPRVTRDAQKLLISMILEGKTYEEIQPVISEIVRKYRAREYSLDEIGIPGGIGKELSEYDRPDSQVRGAIYSNRHLGTNFGKNSKPKRLYIKSVPFEFVKTDVLCFDYPDQVPKNFVIDMEKMLEKSLQNPLTRILSPVGWQWGDFDPATPTLAKWGIG